MPLRINISEEEQGILLLEYSSENGTQWLMDKLKEYDSYVLKRTYRLTKKDIYDEQSYADKDLGDMSEMEFVIANVCDGYWKFNKEVLGININLYIHNSIRITERMFRAPEDIAIFKKINNLVSKDIYITNSDCFHDGQMPLSVFKEVINKFPTTYEIQKYREARISSVINDYLAISVDAEEKYEKYLNNKIKLSKGGVLPSLKPYEKMKYEVILERLEHMLSKQSDYSEKNWQVQLLDIILLIYPKYSTIIDSVRIKVPEGGYKEVDYILLDREGNVDIIEIKKPNDKKIMSESKYRNNHIPLKELSGTIMQTEKYLLYLNKWGEIGEKSLSKKYKEKLPNGLDVKIINPSGLIIMGRSHDLSEQQKKDFEIVKRKYKNIIDILTYDEILSALRGLIEKFS